MPNKVEIRARLTFWRSSLEKLREAYLTLLDGGVKSYKIGNEELTRLDLVSLQKRMEETEKRWTNWSCCWRITNRGAPFM